MNKTYFLNLVLLYCLTACSFSEIQCGPGNCATVPSTDQLPIKYTVMAETAPPSPSSKLPTPSPTDAPYPILQFPTLQGSKTPISNNPTLVPIFPPKIPIVESWKTFSDSLGLTISYPANWEVENIPIDPEHHMVNFSLKKNVFINCRYGFTMSVTKGAKVNLTLSNPHLNEPNEGGYEVKWERSVLVNHVPGIIYVWGSDIIGNGDAFLISNISSNQYPISAGLDACLDLEDRLSFTPETFTAQYEKYYWVFDYMFHSIRFYAPEIEK